MSITGMLFEPNQHGAGAMTPAQESHITTRFNQK
jgi:hypothetical protein